MRKEQFEKLHSGEWICRSGKYRYPAITLHCVKCNKEFQRRKSVVNYDKPIYCSRSCANKTNIDKSRFRGENSPFWVGGRQITSTGYALIYAPEHPFAQQRNKSGGYVLEHRLVMEKILGRYLQPHETVHHKNGIKLDNRPNNLELRCGYHPQGTSPEDLVPWAQHILELYSTYLLNKEKQNEQNFVCNPKEQPCSTD